MNKNRIFIAVCIVLALSLVGIAQASLWTDIVDFFSGSSDDADQPSNAPDYLNRTELQRFVSVSQGTLSDETPQRAGNAASVTSSGATLSIVPENLMLEGYYYVTRASFLQCGEFELRMRADSGSALRRTYNASDISVQIISENSGVYRIAEMYRKGTETRYPNITKTHPAPNETVLRSYIEETPILEYDNATDGYVFKEYQNITYYIVEDTARPYQAASENEITALNLVDDGVYLRICAPNKTSDIFDLQFTFGNTSILLPAPSFNTSSQADWNQGVFNGTYANASGFLVLNRTRQEISADTAGLNNLSMLFHFDNDSSGESSTKMVNFAGFNNATCTNCPLFSAGFIGKASEFDGANDIWQVSEYNEIRYVGDNLTLMAWIEPDFNLSHANNREIMRKAGASGTDAYRLLFAQNANQYRFKIDTNGVAQNCDTQLGSNDAPIDVWHHITAVYDGANMKVYWDGRLNNTCATTGTIRQSSGNFNIGSFNPGTNPWDGKLDEVAIWNRSLSAQEIKTIYNYQLSGYLKSGTYESKVFDAGETATFLNLQWASPINHSGEIHPGNFNESNLTLLLHFNQDPRYGESSTRGYDHSGNGHNATCSGGSCPQLNSDGAFRKDYTYAVDYFDIANSSTLNFSNTNFAVSVWVNVDNVSEPTHFISKYNLNGARRGWALGVHDFTRKFMFTIATCFDSTTYFYSNLTYEDHQYHHVVMRRTNGISEAFVDGIKQPENVSTLLCDGNNSIRLGTYFSDTAANPFWGKVDELAVFNRSLADSEIKEIYSRKPHLIKAQVRSCDDNSCSGESYAANESDSAYLLNLSLTPNSRYFQYRLFLENDDFNSTPYVRSANGNYVLRPVISGLANYSTDNQSSSINWTCDQLCNYTLRWYNNSARTSAYLLGTVSNSSFAASGWVRISGLLNSTPHYLSLDVAGVGGLNRSNTTFSFTTRKNYANEAQGDQILVQAVQNALLSSYTLYSEHQAYVSYAPASQLLARFDQVATKGNKTWALNYGTMADTFTGMQNITPVFYVLELVNRTSDNLLFDVESFINQTK